MKTCLLPLTFALFVIYGEAAVARLVAKRGDTVPVSLSADDRIRRDVAAGVQYFHTRGEHAGKFVSEDGTEVDSTNYDFCNGTLFIKKFADADVGSYRNEPNVVLRKSAAADGGVTAVAGNVIVIEMENE